MAKRKPPKGPPYAVGFKRPPKATQFKKGASGNPKGRPKGTRPVGSVLRGIFEQRVAVTENGKIRRLPKIEVMLQKMANDAMRGDKPALKLALAFYERYGQGEEADLQLDEILAEDQEILARFLEKPKTRKRKRKPTNAKKRGK